MYLISHSILLSSPREISIAKWNNLLLSLSRFYWQVWLLNCIYCEAPRFMHTEPAFQLKSNFLLKQSVEGVLSVRVEQTTKWTVWCNGMRPGVCGARDNRNERGCCILPHVCGSTPRLGWFAGSHLSPPFYSTTVSSSHHTSGYCIVSVERASRKQNTICVRVYVCARNKPATTCTNPNSYSTYRYTHWNAYNHKHS